MPTYYTLQNERETDMMSADFLDVLTSSGGALFCLTNLRKS